MHTSSAARAIVYAGVLAVASAAAAADGYSYGNPTAAEQYMLEVLNRMRADPDGTAASYGIDLNEGPPSEAISNVPAQPLVMNSGLIATARGHTDDMLARDFFDHVNPDGLTPSDRAVAEGYSQFVGENLALATVGIMNEAQGVKYLLEVLFVDEDIDGRGHRVNLMRPTFAEVGIGFARGFYETFDVYVVTQNFGSDNGPFVTGVCYSDINGSGTYDLGEGLSGVTVIAGGQDTITATAGGYAIPITGTFNVTANGNGIDTVVNNITVIDENVKIDFTPLGVPNTPPSVAAGSDRDIDLDNADAVSLNGSVSDDGEPNPPGTVTTTWSLASGTGTAVFLDASTAVTVVDLSDVGIYVLRLSATDGALSSYDEITITVTDNGGGGGDSDSGGGCFVRAGASAGRAARILAPQERNTGE